MKWIGQHIWDFISRFRSDVYLEDISSGTIASGGNLGLDSNNKVVKANVTTDTNTNQLTTFTLTGDSGSNQTIAHGNTLDVAGGNGISTVVGATDTVTVNIDASQTTVTSITNLTTLSAGSGESIATITLVLPTEDPGATGRLWNDEGTLKISL
tara:strand:- start:249 stop:710 length:462 start_codon:yes stop_codon:yes gene_type:complete